MPEPPHVHVDRGDRSAKLWLDPVAVARNLGYPAHEMLRLERLVQTHREEFLEAWYDFFSS